MTEQANTAALGTGKARKGFSLDWRYAVLFLVLGYLYWHASNEMYKVWKLSSSYYTHGFLVPIVSAVLIWQKRDRLAQLERIPALVGYVWIVGACLFLLMGDYLSFRVFSQLSLIPMIVGVCLLFEGTARTRTIWFPIAYLIFMIPIPPSLTQSILFKLKIVAAKSAVLLSNGLGLPMVQDGSRILWSTPLGIDQLQVGDVCGGLRSLIALLAFGALMAYLSKTQSWAKILLLAVSPFIAVIANVFRIFLLCIVGYFWGSEIAAGTVHDVSGYMIFVVAFAMFFGLEMLLRKYAPQRSDESTEDAS